MKMCRYFVFGFLFCFGFSSLAQNKKIKEVLHQKEVFLVDVRTFEEFRSGSVKNAINIPLDSLENQLYRFKDKKNIILFCRSGRRSEKAQQILKANGITAYNALTPENIKKLQKK